VGKAAKASPSPNPFSFFFQSQSITDLVIAPLRVSVRKIDNVVFSAHLYPCHVELDEGRSKGVLFVASAKQSQSYEKNTYFLAEHAQGSHAEAVLGVFQQHEQSTIIFGCGSSTHSNAEPVFSQSGYALVIMVEPGQYRNCHHLFLCIMRGTR
jgi:hypothetical protein